MLTAHWLSKADLVALLPAPSDTIAAPSKMAAATADPGAGNPQVGDSSGGDSGGGLPSPGEQELSRRLQRLYPAVNQHETPLPRSWSPKDKYNYIGLSQGNLRVHYKGHGKNHKDAASVRATHPIPAACGIYYFEVKIVSKGRDGYMGIGLSAQGVNMNRLPGWDKHSYGYHGDDGHSFCSSGTGQPYGPTFTTGDVIGCCVNLINGTCFYTKNGHSLGRCIRTREGFVHGATLIAKKLKGRPCITEPLHSSLGNCRHF